MQRTTDDRTPAILTDSLPIDAVLPEVLAAVADPTNVILKAPPGAGKTTGVPLALLRWGQVEGQIWIAQPRRLAARAASARIADGCQTKVGEEVGYQVRFEKRWSPQTRIVTATTGVLLRRLQADPFLKGIGAVLLDEFHERSLEVDLALGMLVRLKQTVRPDLRLIVMSATLDPQPIADFLRRHDCATACVQSDGRSYPVEINYSLPAIKNKLEQEITNLLEKLLRSTKTEGHILVFLPGVGEIRRVLRQARQVIAPKQATLMPLYGDLPPDEQDAVLRPSRKRKIVLATNVAETSITIPDVTIVIDSGLARVLRFDPSVGLPKLEVEPISIAAADQRSGRAGRTAPGYAYRLWPENANRGRPLADTPEIQRGDCAAAVLSLFGWGEHQIHDFPWLDPPRKTAVQNATDLLRQLDAIDGKQLTGLGKQMLRMPIHPRLARLLLAGRDLGISGQTSVAAALLSERDPFRSAHRPPQVKIRGQRVAPLSPSAGKSDIVDQVHRLTDFASRAAGSPREGGDHLNVPAAKHVLRVADQLREMSKPQAEAGEEAAAQGSASADPDELLMRALLAAYPDRLAKRRAVRNERAVAANGLGMRLDGQSCVQEGDLFVAIDVQQGATDAKVRKASLVLPEWLDERHWERRDECFFHPTQKQVVRRRRHYWNGLLLREAPLEFIASEQTQDLLYQHALRHWKQVFPEDEKLQRWLLRVRSVARWCPELELPQLDQGKLERICWQLCLGPRSLAELRLAPWDQYARSCLTYDQQQLIDRYAPERLRVPSGNEMVIHYSGDQPPVLAVRLQELFGWTETPRIAAGKVALQLHLLGPNYRPQQITEDLASFWQNTYPQVRKDLRRRYPKHQWPEDPLHAVANRSGLSRDAKP